jgi:pyruvyltransferase
MSSLASKITGFFKKKEKVGLYYWSPNDERGRENFGDLMSKKIVNKIVDTQIDEEKSVIDYDGDQIKNRILAIGSIIQNANSGDTIWGSGMNGKSIGKNIDVEDLDIRMVRGPLTRDYLSSQNIKCPQKYGEPGLLLPNLFETNAKLNKKRDFSLVLNINDIKLYDDKDYIIYPNRDFNDIIKKIRQSKMIISTSLHGIVVAEAFGIPARHLLSYSEPIFKYRDYYLGTGRPNVRYAHTLEEALELGGARPPEINSQSMIEQFPFDLFQ